MSDKSRDRDLADERLALHRAPFCRTSSASALGGMRAAAPVGHARTHAGPAFRFEHRSHFAARAGPSSFFFKPLILASPNRGAHATRAASTRLLCHLHLSSPPQRRRIRRRRSPTCRRRRLCHPADTLCDPCAAILYRAWIEDNADIIRKR